VNVSAARRRSLLAVALLGLITVLAACGGGEEPDRFTEDGAPFSFSYPPDLQKVFADTGREIKGVEPDYRVAFGIDETNVVVAATYPLMREVAMVEETDLQVAVQRAARALAKALKADLPERTETKLGDLPATQYEFTDRAGNLTTRLLYAFEGKTQYFVRCQWDADGEDAIPAACDEVAETFSPAG
jgi:hypothetical protein